MMKALCELFRYPFSLMTEAVCPMLNQLQDGEKQ